MKKLQKLLKAVFLALKQPSLLNKVLDDTAVNKQEVIKKHGLRKGLPVIDIAELLPGLNGTIDHYSFLDGTSTPLDLLLLKLLAKRFKECSYLEIGTWRGESVANVASSAKSCVTINLPDKMMRKKGLPEKYIELHRFFSKNIPTIRHIQADSKTFDFNSLNEKYDLIFIDGDHHYESVVSDTRNAFRLLKDEGSVIVWHDYGNTPEDIRWDVLKGILDGTPEGKRGNLFRVSNTLCAIYTTEKIKSEDGDYPQAPNKHFKINIEVVK